MELHPQLIEKNGKNEFVVLPFAEFEALTELLQDYEDLMDLRSAKASSVNEQAIPLVSVLSELGL